MRAIAGRDLPPPYLGRPQRREEIEIGHRQTPTERLQARRKRRDPPIGLVIGNGRRPDEQGRPPPARVRHHRFRMGKRGARRCPRPTVFDDAIIDAEGEDDPAIGVGRKPGRGFVLPTVRDIFRGVAPDAEIVIGKIAPAPPRRGADPARPAEAFRIARAIDEAIAEKADPHVHEDAAAAAHRPAAHHRQTKPGERSPAPPAHVSENRSRR